MHRVHPHHQAAEENQHHRPRCQHQPCNHHRRPFLGGGRQVHLPRLYHFLQFISGRGAQREDRESSHRHGPPDKEGVGKHQADTQQKDEGVRSLRTEHSSVWRNKDSVLTPRAKTECLPHAQSHTTSGHHLAKPSYQCKRLVPGRHAKHVCHPRPGTPALAWTRVQNGGWPHPHGHPVWRAHHRKAANPALQGCLQEGPQGMWLQPS